MSRFLPMLLLWACADLPSDPQPDAACTEILNPVDASERSPWGTTANGVRVMLGDRAEGSLTTTDTTSLTVQPGWPAGLIAIVRAEANETPADPPPYWCSDRLELPASVTLSAGDGRLDVDGEPVEVVGTLWAIGTWADLESVFTGRVPGTTWPELLPEGTDPDAVELAVWLQWVPGDGVAHVQGSLRVVEVGSDGLDGGEIVGTVAP